MKGGCIQLYGVDDTFSRQCFFLLVEMGRFTFVGCIAFINVAFGVPRGTFCLV